MLNFQTLGFEFMLCSVRSFMMNSELTPAGTYMRTEETFVHGLLTPPKHVRIFFCLNQMTSSKGREGHNPETRAFLLFSPVTKNME
jgi:hypothetical protein